MTPECSHATRYELNEIPLIAAITCRVTNLLSVIESMGTTLNSEEMMVRKEALDTLAEVIRTLPVGFLDEAEVAPLLVYFNAQLKGHPDHSRAAIIALKALVSFRTSQLWKCYEEEVFLDLVPGESGPCVSGEFQWKIFDSVSPTV